MNIHVLFFCVLSAGLFDKNTHLINAQTNLYTKVEGEDFRFELDTEVTAGSRKYICRNDSEKEDILIETTENRAESGRYIIRYDISDKKVRAVIKELTQSDSGRYKIGVSNSSSMNLFQEVELNVRELCEEDITSGKPKVYSATVGGEVTIRCLLPLHQLNIKFLCKDECKKMIINTNNFTVMNGRYEIEYWSNMGFNVTITSLTKSDSGRYKCGVRKKDAKNTCLEFEISVTDGNILLLAVCVTVVVVLLAVFVLLFYKLKIKRNVQYVNTRGNGRNMEVAVYDDVADVYQWPADGSTYQELSSREEPLYSLLEPPPNTNLH
ncbi:polymeric immunoglobulin receptor-like [Oreochromis aureus]|uniref:polymeric immunoglobulin receptor-like n=1 Tax=Oreochromis aureus TaxID=47969 RepID=UPI001953B886|nr:polymeric immunoglobulin receptor-like [Oreochromis aureus]